MTVIFSDLDGTLLDKHSYSWEPAREALDRIRKLGVPLVLVSSKTRAEMEHWRRELGNQDPFIVENGGAAFLPEGYFAGAAGSLRDGYQVLEWGTPYGTLCAALRKAARAARCRLEGFHELSAADIAQRTELTLEQAAMARLREYDEPFFPAAGCDEQKVREAVESLGLRLTRGGRLPHLHGNNDKAVAVQALTQLFRSERPDVRTIGLGDAPNDLPFLQIVDQPVIIRSADSESMSRQLPGAIVTGEAGPRGWNQAVMALLDQS